MCCIITSPDQAHRPTLQTLRLVAEQNPHGSGLAWVERGAVYYLKGLGPKAILKDLEEVPGPMIIHFRIATVGGTHKSLCHPFPIRPRPAAKLYGSAPAVLFQNGTWSAWQEYMDVTGLELSGPISDTRVLAAAVHQRGFDWLAQVQSRFAMLTAENEIQRLGDWHLHRDGCHYSNTYWMPRISGRSLVSEAMACFGE